MCHSILAREDVSDRARRIVPRWSMYRRCFDHLHVVLASVIALVALSGCGDPLPTTAPFIPPDQVFWALTMNHKAVNLSLEDPYDTLTLRAIPGNINRDPLPDVPLATFRAGTPTDTSVVVYPDGRIEAREETVNDGGVMVIATLTYNDVTRSDTTFVTVTAVTPPPRMADFRFQLLPGDSARIAGQGYLDIRFKPLSIALFVQDSAASIIPRLNVFYESSNREIATVDRQSGLLTAFRAGLVTIRATTMAYGIAKTDSLVVTVTDPLVQVIQLGAALREVNGTYTMVPYVFSDRKTFLAVGGTVLWDNRITDSVDIMFDNPDAALKGTGLQGLLYADTTGNMAPFGSITLDDIKQEAAFLRQTDNRILTVVQPDKQGLLKPDTAALLAAIPRIAAQPVTAYADKVETMAVAGLLDALPTPGKIVSEKKDPETDITEWTLSNGAVVLLKPTKFRASEILFTGVSQGGLSLVPESDYPSAAFSSLVGTGGWGRYSLSSLSRQLSGKIVDVGSAITGITENIQGSTTWKDLESLLQMVHLVMREPRYDSNAIRAVLQRNKVSLANRSANPEAVFSDTIAVTMAMNSKRSPLVSVALLDQIRPEKVFAIYKERFADASDFVFMFVGAFNPDSLKPYAERYLASLPALNRKETPKRLSEWDGPPGIVRKTVRAGREDKSSTILQFPGSRETFTRQDANDLSVMTDVLQNRLIKRLREELGGTYGVRVGVNQSPKPVSRYMIGIQFVAEPARRAELLAAVFAVIDSLKRVPPTADEIHRVIEPALRDRDHARRTNGYWLGLADFRLRGRPYKEALDDTILTSTTPDRVQKAAQKYINLKNYQEFNLVPE